MKKTNLLIMIAITAAIVSCYYSAPRQNTSDPKVMTDAEAVAADKAALEIGYAGDDTADNVTQNITLPTTGLSGTTISWSSDNATSIKNTGSVTQPSFGTVNTDVKLTATIARGTASDTATFSLIVIAKSAICAATNAGVSISADHGDTWTAYTSPTIGSNIVNGVFSTGSSIYAATAAGLSVSGNGGTSWTTYTTTNGLGSNTVYGVFVTGTTMYAATSEGLSYKALKVLIGHTSWSTYTAKNGPGDNPINGVFVYSYRALGLTTTTITKIFAATTTGLYVAVDDGSTCTWTKPLDGKSVNAVYASGKFATTIYAATTTGLYISTNSGTDWTPYVTGTNGIPNNTVNWVYYFNPNIYVATSAGLSRSGNSGTTWSSLNTVGSLTVNCVYISGLNIYAATNNGLYISTDNGENWENYVQADGLGSNTVYEVYAK